MILWEMTWLIHPYWLSSPHNMACQIPTCGKKKHTLSCFFFCPTPSHTGLDFSCPPLLTLPPSHLHTSSNHHPLAITHANSYPSHNTNHHYPLYTSSYTSPPLLPHCNFVQHHSFSTSMCSPSHNHTPSLFTFAPPPCCNHLGFFCPSP